MLAYLAQNMLAIATAALGMDAPARRFVSMGEPVAESGTDCGGQLTVHLDQLVPELQTPKGCALVTRVRYCTEVFRCVPTSYDDGMAPTPEDLGDNATALMNDLGRIWAAYSAARTTGALAPGQDCTDVTLQTATPIPPRGGMGGWRICVDIRLSTSLATGS